MFTHAYTRVRNDQGDFSSFLRGLLSHYHRVLLPPQVFLPTSACRIVQKQRKLIGNMTLGPTSALLTLSTSRTLRKGN